MIKLTLSLLALAGLHACASSAQNKRLDEKVAAQNDVSTNRQLDQKQSEIISHTSNLSAEQRQKLSELQLATRNKLAALHSESVKLRAVLLQELLADKPNNKEINAAKKRLTKLSDERLDTIFGAANQTNELIGRNGMLRDAMDIQFLEDNFNAY